MRTSTIESVLRIASSYGSGAFLILFMRTMFILYRPDIVDDDDRPNNILAKDMLSEYDFIIVGAGSAGCVLANRLTENPAWTVLLIEAGGNELYLTDVPVLFPVLQVTPIDWQFKTEYSGTSCLAMKKGQCNWPRGKIMGGSSTINAMMYIRGNRKDYDNWEALGNPGWSYKDVLPYFIKSEDNRIVNTETGYHGTGGPLTVEEFRYQTPMATALLQAGEEMGYKWRDLNGASQVGFSMSPATIRDGLRCSTSKAFIRPVSNRPNLHITMLTSAHKVILDDSNKATGVRMFKIGQGVMEVGAKKEVILSAGSLNSPQLLMLSGIGPEEHLAEVGIPTRVNLPGIGENLYDHIAMGGISYTVETEGQYGPQGIGFVLPRTITFANIANFVFERQGPLYSMPVGELMAFINTKYADPAEDFPDVQLIIGTYGDNSDGGEFGKRAMNIRDDFYAQVFEPMLYRDTYTILPLVIRPKSKGRLRLKSSSPLDRPLVYPNYFNDTRDLDVMVEGIKFGYEMSKTYVMKNLKATINPNPFLGCEHLEFLSDEYWACCGRHYTMTIYHPVGTCKMAPSSDPEGVVDHNLKVRGVPGLRVIDASIMPYITTGNTNAPVIMIAERGADFIKNDWGYPITELPKPNIGSS